MIMMITWFVFSSIFFILFCAIYFLPSIFAFKKNHRNKLEIFILNFLLGWVIIGWIVAFVWASVGDSRHPVI